MIALKIIFAAFAAAIPLHSCAKLVFFTNSIKTISVSSEVKTIFSQILKGLLGFTQLMFFVHVHVLRD